MSSSAGPDSAGGAITDEVVAVEYTVEMDEMLARAVTVMSLGERRSVSDDFVRRSAIKASRFYTRNYFW